METREKFRQEMQVLRKSVYEMTQLSIKQLHRGLDAIKRRDLDLARDVISKDAEIDELQIWLDDYCIKLIATEQPVAGDLREIVSIIKIVSSIARIGDHAKHLAKGSKRLSDAGRNQFLSIITEMAERGIDMLEKAVHAFAEQDLSLANKTAALDDKIDDLKKKLSSRIIEFMKLSPANIEEGASLLFLNRFMERLGDHVTNLCEWVHFAQTGEHVDLD